MGDKEERVKSKGKKTGCEIVFSTFGRGAPSRTSQKFGCLVILVLFLWLSLPPICLFVLFWHVCFLLYLILFYYYLGACLYSNERKRKKRYGFGVGGW